MVITFSQWSTLYFTLFKYDFFNPFFINIYNPYILHSLLRLSLSLPTEEQEPNKSLILRFSSLSLPISLFLPIFFFFTPLFGPSASQSLPLFLPHSLSISSSPSRSPTLGSLSLFLPLFFSPLPFSFTLVLINAVAEGWVGEMG